MTRYRTHKRPFAISTQLCVVDIANARGGGGPRFPT